MMLFDLLTLPIDSSSIPLAALPIVDVAANFHLQFEIADRGLVIAQQFQNVDLIANMQTGWDDFLKTGKAGALAIGLVMGYIIRGITR